MKFHTHETDNSEMSATLEKINENIVSQIKKTFTDVMDITQSIQSGIKKTYTEPTLVTASETNPDKKTRKEMMLSLKIQIDYEHWIKERRVV